MTITNHPSDGLYPELITLFRATADHGSLRKEELIELCTVKGETARISAALSTWTELGLFSRDGDNIALDVRFQRKRRGSIEDMTNALPSICRQLLLDLKHALPMWPASGERTDKGIGLSADFVRGLAWMLAQDIYTFPLNSTSDEAERLENHQVTPGKYIVLNDVRWHGLGFWARYTGFAAADRGYIDPTSAIRAELPTIFQGTQCLPAGAFLRELSSRIPVLDFGAYRTEVEGALNPAVWRRPPEGQLSTALSFALRRLQLDQTIGLNSAADAGESYALSARDFRPWHHFSEVEFHGISS